MPSYSPKISEATLKNKVAKDFFSSFDTTNDLNSNIDFIVASKEDSLFLDYYCFAEAKKGKEDNITSLIQLILTIGKNKKLPTPSFLAAFNCQEIIFIPFSKIRFIFAQNDFNWNIRPSDHHSKEFAQMHALISEILEQEKLSYSFERDEKELRHFITSNFQGSAEPLEINENNLVEVYEKWLYNVSHTIIFSEENRKQLRTEYGAIEADFFLADLLPVDKTLLDKLYILLEQDKYKIIRDKKGAMRSLVEVPFTDKQAAHKAFWRRYKRPPDKKIWDALIERRDLLVPTAR